MTEPDDAELWRRIQRDDADAFGLLFERHGARITAYALRRTGDPATAEDVTAVVFLETWRRRSIVELQQDSALPWLYGVAGNTIRHWRRSARRHDAALARLASLPPRASALVERQAEVAAEAAEVIGQIRRLPRRDREVLLLSVFEGLSHAEIGEALGISVPAVKSRLSRSRSRLSSSRPWLDASVDRDGGEAPVVTTESVPSGPLLPPSSYVLKES